MQNTAQHHLYITTDSVFVFADFSTSGYDHDFKVKIQVNTQNKVLEIKLRVVFTKVGLLLKDENTLISKISQEDIIEFGPVRLFAGSALRTFAYVLFSRLSLSVETDKTVVVVKNQAMPGLCLFRFSSHELLRQENFTLTPSHYTSPMALFQCRGLPLLPYFLSFKSVKK